MESDIWPQCLGEQEPEWLLPWVDWKARYVNRVPDHLEFDPKDRDEAIVWHKKRIAWHQRVSSGIATFGDDEKVAWHARQIAQRKERITELRVVIAREELLPEER